MSERLPFRCLSLALAVVAASLAGCNGSSSQEKTDPGQLTVGFIYIGARQDYGYNQAHALGAAAVKKMPGVRVVEEEMVPDTQDVQKTMKSMIKLDGAQIVFPTSFGYYEPHVLTHGGPVSQGQVHSLRRPVGREGASANIGTYFGFIDECQYISGVVAGHTSRSKKLGFIAGKPIPQVRRNINAFTMGARSVDPAITCTVIFTGDWSMPVKEADGTVSLIDKGIDVLTCHVNSPKVIVETAERRGAFTCGYHFDQSTPGAEGLFDRRRVGLGKGLHRLLERDTGGQVDSRPGARRPQGGLRAACPPMGRLSIRRRERPATRHGPSSCRATR